MTAKTRYFFVGSTLVLALGLGIGTVAYYGGVPHGLFAAGPGPEELRYVPEDAVVVAYADVKDVMQSELRQRLVKLESSSEENGRDEFKKETGIDIERDIDHVVAYVSPKGDGREPSGLILTRGHFDEARIDAVVREHGGQVEQYRGKRIYASLRHKGKDGEKGAEIAAGDRKHAELAFSFIEPGLAVMGSADLVKQAIDRSGKRSITDNADFRTRIADVADGSVWAVGRFDQLSSRVKMPAEVTQRIPPVTWFAARGHINGGVQAMLTAEAQTDEAANNLRDIIRGFTALAKMSAGNRPETQALWPEIELGGTGKTVSVSCTVSSALLDALGKVQSHGRKSITSESGTK
jgi:hypothetical protein